MAINDASRKTLLACRLLILIVSVGLLGLALPSRAVAVVSLLSVGDSLTEGVQSADANVRTQPQSYIALLARQMNAYFPLPLIQTSPAGLVGTTGHRHRLFPWVQSPNLAVSGATVHDVLYDRALALTPANISTETEMVLYPRTGSQIEVAESLGAKLIVCWIGNNDALGAALAFNHYDASQLTPVDEFRKDYEEITRRLGAVSDHVVLLNIPNVTDIGFLMDGDDLTRFLGSDYGLPAGSYTSMMTMLMIKLGRNDGSILKNPDYVLDANEVGAIQARVDAFNQVIADTAAAQGMPVLDVNFLFRNALLHPYTFFGIPLQRRLLGGIFSLDGVHLSNIAHALVANELIRLIDSRFHMTIPELAQDQLQSIFVSDPFVDKDGDGRVTGRPAAGLLETLGPALGLSGDPDDPLPDSPRVK